MPEKVIEYLHKLRFDDLPKEVIEKAKLCTLDTLGVALAGSVTTLGKVARTFAIGIGGKQENTIYKYGDKVSCVPAAYANGTMSFCHNFTDTTLSCVIHCGPVVVPTALGICEKEKKSGKDFLVAVVAGYEMMTRIGNVINSGKARMMHHQRGFHATCTTGAFGACISAAKLLGLSAEQMLDALGVAGSYSSGILESVTSPETEVWRSHTGIAAQNGTSAALLAQLGLRGPRSVLEGRNGFFRAFGGKNIDLLKLDETLGKNFLIMDSAFKLHNCAHVWAGPLDCLRDLSTEHSIPAEDIAEIKLLVPSMYSFVMEDSETPKYPTNYAEAQNNPYYTLAVFLIHGGLYLKQFGPDVISDPRVKRLSERVVIQVDPELDEIFQSTDKAPFQLTLRLRSKREFSMTLDYPRGSPKNPATKTEILHKFVELAAVVMEREKANEIAQIIDELDHLDHLGELTEHLVG